MGVLIDPPQGFPLRGSGSVSTLYAAAVPRSTTGSCGITPPARTYGPPAFSAAQPPWPLREGLIHMIAFFTAVLPRAWLSSLQGKGRGVPLPGTCGMFLCTPRGACGEEGHTHDIEGSKTMPLMNRSVQHRHTFDEARTRLETIVHEVTSRFGTLVRRVEWSTDRSQVRLEGIGR